MDREKPVLIAAASGRALAAGARRAGYLPLVADGFGDQDTLAEAGRHVRVDFVRPINGDRLMAALQTLADGRNCAGIVCGSGFEDRADLLGKIARRWPLLGNRPETIARLKDPLEFAQTCRAAKIPHPESSLVPAADLTDWLVKRIGGAGGWHVVPADRSKTRDKDVYFQRRVKGQPVSALLLGNGNSALVLGFSAQWTAPTLRHPFRYGGAVRPAPLSEDVEQAMVAAVRRLVAKIPLVGLNSADFVVDGDAFQLLEVNPRPSATFDLFEPEEASLFALHVDACHGTLPASAPRYRAAMAGAIVYAERDIAATPALDWPEWTADRSLAGVCIEAQQPVCSVFARGETAYAAKQLVEQRSTRVHALLAAGMQ
ncbi:MAG: ATP-grasp domain-containing protein [Pseudolabrys sp.]